MKQKRKIFLVNNKEKEPDFEASFSVAVKKARHQFESIHALDCSYSYSRSKKTLNLYLKGQKVPLGNSNWFIRRWNPSEDATALLSVFLKLHHIPFLDSKVNAAHEILTSKLSQTFQLAKNGCACPSTWVIPLSSFTSVEGLAEKELSFPVVVKARGGLGKRVWKCDSRNALRNKITELKRENRDHLVILQEMIKNEGDLRVIIFKGKVIASIERSNTDGFLNNISQGGTARSIKLSSEEKRLAVRAAKTVGIDLAGVDIVRTKTGPLVFEVNKAPDISSFNEATGFDIGHAIATEYLKSLTK